MWGVEDLVYEGWDQVLREVRDCLGLDQDLFGHLMGGYTRSQIQRYETCNAEPPIAFWNRFSRVTSLSLTWVFTGMGDPYVPALQMHPDFGEFSRWVDIEDHKVAMRERQLEAQRAALEAIQKKEEEESAAKLRSKASRTQKKRGSRRSKGQ